MNDSLNSYNEIAPVRVGTSGYHFLDWKGVFYPDDIDRAKMLDYYARHFDTVEINSTYYGIPNAKVFENMLKKTGADFEYMVKAHQSVTHKRELLQSETPKYLEAIVPLRDSGRLRGILAQFPWSFSRSKANTEHISLCRELFRDFPFFVEFRHASWISQDTFDYLRKRDIGYVSVDEPQLANMIEPIAVATGDVAYVRLHGRNADKWYSGAERYNYLYNRAELLEWVKKVQTLRKKAKRVYTFFNNCHLGRAVINAKQFREMLDESES